MTKEDKDLLLKDIYARIPYGVEGCCEGETFRTTPLHWYAEYEVGYSIDYMIIKSGWRPYLFPLSSMTEEQKKDIFCNGTFFISNRNELGRFPKHSDDYDYVTIDDYLMIYKKLIKNHFDVNGLIPKDLAIDATGLNIY